MALLTTALAKRSTNGNDLAGVAAAVGGDTFTNYGSEVVVFRNESVGAITVTFATPVTVDGLAVDNLAVVVGAGERRLVGPFPPGMYNDNLVAGGIVAMTYSGVTTFFVNVIKVTPVA